MSLDRFLDSASRQGRLDSQGAFTIGWQQALAKLQTFRATDPTNFLLMLVSAGRAYGARNISILEQKSRVTLTMHDCYVSESAVRSGFQAVVSGGFQHQAFDLASGLQGGLQYGFSTVSLTSVHPAEPSYCWTLRSDSEQQGQVAQAEEKICTTVSFLPDSQDGIFQRLFGRKTESTRLGGYVGLDEAGRLVDKRCEHSDIPITINRHLVNRPYHLPRTPIGVEVGELSGIKLNSFRVLKLEREQLKGALAFQSGPLKVVVNGLVFELGVHREATGILWATLNRDLSRQRILQDEFFEDFNRDLNYMVSMMQEVEDEMFPEDTPCSET